MDEFIDKVVLITGAGRGAGREVALGFSSLGAMIAANDINPISLDETVGQIRCSGSKAEAFVFDVAKRMPIEGLVAQVVEQFGRIDILVNHASVRPDAHLLEMDEWDYHRTLDVNLAGPFFTMQQVGRVMRQQGSGVIINLTSSSRQGQVHKGHAAFLASQAGLVSLTHVAARELAAYHIRVNSVFHGAKDIDLVPPLDWDDTAFRHWCVSLPVLNQSEYQDLVCIVLYLCSSATSLTGQVISLDHEVS